MNNADSKTRTAAALQPKHSESSLAHAGERAGLFGAEQQQSFFPAPIQTKLTVNKPGDSYEQEADKVADQVVQRLAENKTGPTPAESGKNEVKPVIQRLPITPIQRSALPTAAPAVIQAKCVACEGEEKLQKKEEEEPEVQSKIQRKPIFDSAAEPPDEGQGNGSIQRKPIFESAGQAEEGPVQRREMPGANNWGAVQMKCAACAAEEKEPVQRAESGDAAPAPSNDFGSRLQSSKGGGSPLPAEVSSSMGEAMGADLSNVRVHTGSEAAGMSSSIQAQAFTHGSDVYFNEGKYSPGSSEGKKLLAHELVHTVQQGGTEKIQKNSDKGTASINKHLTSHIQTKKGAFPEVPTVEEGKQVKKGNLEDKKTETESKGEGKEGGKDKSKDSLIDIPPVIQEEQGPSKVQLKPTGNSAKINISTRVETIQRFTAPAQNIANPVPQETPNDGDPIRQTAEQKKADNADRKGEEISREDKLKEARAFKKAGPTVPPVDRGAAAKATSIEQKAEIEQKVNAEKESQEGEKKDAKGKEGKKSKGEMLAAKAEGDIQKAHSLAPPTKPEPFVHPIIQTPVDQENEELPQDKETDESVTGLGYIGELLAEQGYNIQMLAYEEEKNSYGLDAVLNKTREDVAYSDEGITILNANNEMRTKINEDSAKGLEESNQRQRFVAEQAAGLDGEIGEKKTDSEQLKSDAESKSQESKSNAPDDEDAAADAEKQNADLESSTEGTAKADDAVKGAQTKNRALITDAENAAEKNTSTQATIKESADILIQTKTRIDQVNAKNEQSKSQIANASGGPTTFRTHAQQNYQVGIELIKSAKTIQTDLTTIQSQYISESAQVPGKKAIEKKEKEEAEKQNAPDSEIEELLIISKMGKEEQERYVDGMEALRKQQLLDKLNLIIAKDEESEKNKEGGGEGETDKRLPWYEVVKNLRKGRLKKVFGTADEKMGYLTSAQKRMLAEKLKEESIKGDIKNIFTWQSVKQMLNPLNLAKGIVTGPWTAIKEIGSGLKNFPEKWKTDPLGAVLQAAADITTGLATLFSSIAALAGVLVAVLTIASFFFPPAFVPVPFLGSVFVFCGKGALICGGLSVFFNRLAYMKNLSDAGTAETAEGLFKEVGEMKKNNYDELKGAMAMVEGAGAMKMGAALKVAPKPKFLSLPFAQRMTALKEAGKAGLHSIKTIPKRFINSVARIFGKGKEALKQFRDWLKSLFGKKKGGLDADIPEGVAKPSKQNTVDIPDNKKMPKEANYGEIEGQKVKTEKTFNDGHKAKVLEDGQCAICTNCEKIRGKFNEDLKAKPEMETELKGYEDRLKNNPHDTDAIAGQKKIHDELVQGQTERISPKVKEMEKRIADGDRTITKQEYEQYHRDKRLLDDNMGKIRERYEAVNPEGKLSDAKIREDIESGKRFDEETGRFGSPDKTVSKRQEYMGATPGKDSATGKKVMDRMLAERRMSNYPPKGPRTRFKDADGNWYDISEADMGHHPKSAVEYWNETGKYKGAKSSEVREWMLDSDNYELEHFSRNRSAGAKSGKTYDPPEKQ